MTEKFNKSNPRGRHRPPGDSTRQRDGQSGHQQDGQPSDQHDGKSSRQQHGQHTGQRDSRPPRHHDGHPPRSKSSLIIGRQPLIEAIRSGRAIDKILLQRNTAGESLAEIKDLAREHNIPIQIVPVEKLNSLTRALHQGVVAMAGLVQYLDLQQVIDHVVAKGEAPLFVMLDGVTDVRNIGAIARSAVCCGAQALVIPDKGVGALNEEAMKSSAGALEIIHICRVGSLLKAVDTLHMNGIKVFTSEMGADKKVYELPMKEPCCIVMGSEDNGVQPYIRKAADLHFTIPMAGNFDSFNVSVAAGIILYEALKNRLP